MRNLPETVKRLSKMELFEFCRCAFIGIVLVIVVDHYSRGRILVYVRIGGKGGPSTQYLIALGI